MTDPDRPIPESYWVIPGRLLAGEYPGSFDPEHARDRIAAFLEAGFDTFIDLTEPQELRPYEPVLREEAEFYGIQPDYLHIPIRDRGLPSSDDLSMILDVLDDAVAAGRKAYVHCWGGVGRTGTIVGCYLVRHGYNGEQALAQLADWWRNIPKRSLYPRTPETDEQVEFIRDRQE